MQPTTTQIELLYVTGEDRDRGVLTEQLGLDDTAVELEVATSVEQAVEILADESVDCALCADCDGQRCLDAVRTIRGEDPAVPIVAFVGDRDQSFVETMLDAGASDIVQSTPAEASPLLVRRRIDGVVEPSNRGINQRTTERYETILNTAVDPIYQLDTAGNIVAVNDAAVEFLGYDRAALVGSDVSLVMDDDDVARGQEFIKSGLTDGNQEVQTLETEIQTSDGERVPCEIHIAVLEMDDEFEGTVGIIRDVSGRRERERQLRERDEFLEQISNSVNDVVWVSTPGKDEIEFVNTAYEDIWGRSTAELFEDARSFLDGVHPEDRDQVREALQRQREDPDSYDETYRVVQPDGEIRWVRDRAFGVYEDGELVRTVGVVQDITERRAAKRELQTERDMFAQGPVVVFKWKAAQGWPVDYVSENVTDLLGYTPSQFESSEVTYAEVVHDEDIERVTQEVQQNSDDSTALFSHDPYRIVTSEGDVRWVKDTTKILREDGEITHYLGYLVDITERKQREQELRTLKEEYETMVETLGDVVYTLDEDYYFMSANGAAEDITGYTCEELEGAHLSLLLSEDDIERGQKDRQRVIDGEIDTGSLELDVHRKDGSKLPVEFRYRQLPSDAGFRGTAGVIRDVSEHKHREQELQAERDLVENIFETSPVGILVIEDGETITQANDRATEILGIDREELIGETVEDKAWNAVSEDGEPVSKADDPVSTVFGTGTPVYGWEAKIAPDGQESTWVSVSAAPMVDEDGDVSEAVITIEDVTERREAQFDLRAEKEFTDQLIDAIDDVLYLFGENGEFRRWNETLEEVTGYEPAELEQRHPTELFEDEHTDRIADAIDAVLETGSTTVEGNLLRKDGGSIPYEFTGALLTGQDGKRLICGIGRDISERKERERQIQRQRDELEQLDRLNAVIRDVDQALVGAESREEIEHAVCELLTKSGHYEFALALEHPTDDTIEVRESTSVAERYVDEMFPIEGVSSAESPGMRALEVGRTQVVRDIEGHPVIGEKAPTETPIEAIAAVPVSYADRDYGVIGVYAGETGTFTEREVEVLDELGDTIGYAIAAIEQREREATLTALYEATRALLGTGTQQEVSDVVVDVATDVLDLPAVGIFLFDDEKNALVPQSATDQLLDFYGGSTEFGPGRAESETWQSYVSGESQYFEDIRRSERVANPDTDARSTLIFPLGEHGVFVAAAEEVDVFDDQHRRLVGLLAATTETALDRVAGQKTLRERDQRLSERTEQLQQFERLGTIFRSATGVIRTATSREGMVDALCETLVTQDPFDFAWMGTVPPDGAGVEPEAWAGRSGAYLDDVSLSLSTTEPAVETATNGEVTVIDNVTDHLRANEWARAAVEHDYQSVLAAPLVHDGTTYGVLAVYATAPSAFDDTTRSVLAELGELIAYGINVVETKQGILAEQVTELELDIRTPDTFLNAVAKLADETVEYREIVPDDGGAARVLFELADPPVEEVLGLEEEFVAVDSLTHAERGDHHLFRATIGAETVAATLLACGAIPTQVRASDGTTRAVVRLPQQLDVREFLNRVQKTYPETDLVSRQTVERHAAARETVRDALDEDLTDRQREVLVTAYESGFFESPRETTGAELADLLGVSQPTVTHHLREAQRRLFADLFEETL